jgi:hypothetical protein
VSIRGCLPPLKEQLDGLAIDAVALHNEADERIIEQLGQGEFRGRNPRQRVVSAIRSDGCADRAGIVMLGRAIAGSGTALLRPSSAF